MKILHYSLGFPPYRTGGLTKFCMDLMREQAKENHRVGLLWPGEIKIFNHATEIRTGKPVYDILNYEVINPVPVPFDEGIKDFDVFMDVGNTEIYKDFLTSYNPDVIHVHTFMGMHKGFLDAAKELGIRIVFTAHDFFTICPKVTMFRHGKICGSVNTCDECGVCNNTALSLTKIQILQSPAYRTLKDFKMVKMLRKQHRDDYLGGDLEKDQNGSVGKPEDYRKLRKHYQNMLSLMDVVHYNSTVTRDAYERVFDIPCSKVIGITHSDIGDYRKQKQYFDGQLRIRYLGPCGGGKGFFILKAALDKLWMERNDFCLDVHFMSVESSPYMKCHERYTYKDLEQIFDKTDVLVVPSIWYETFGYTVLEALSYGVPVVISGTVGAKDIITDGAGIIIDNIDAEKLYWSIKALNSKRLEQMNQAIVESQKILTINEMCSEIEKKVYR